MLISIFGSDYFDPSGVRVDDICILQDQRYLYEPEYADSEWKIPNKVTRIIFGAREVKNERFGRSSYPVPEYVTHLDCIFIPNKNKHEVAEEINKQLRAVTGQ